MANRALTMAEFTESMQKILPHIQAIKEIMSEKDSEEIIDITIGANGKMFLSMRRSKWSFGNVRVQRYE